MGKNKKGNKKRDKEEWKKSSRIARENLTLIEKPRKPVNKSFTAKHDGDECPKCFINIKAGDTVRYNEDGFLIHVRHEQKEITYDICDTCYLAKPCMCEE